MNSVAKNLCNLLLKICAICGRNLCNPRLINIAGLHILMRAIPDGPTDAGRRLHRYWYRESRCQVRTGWQIQDQRKSAQSASKKFVSIRVYKALFWSFYVSFCTFCASLRLKRTVFTRLQIKVRPKGLHSFAFYILIFDFSFLPLLTYLRAYKVFPPHVRRRYLCAYKAPVSMALWTKASLCVKARF